MTLRRKVTLYTVGLAIALSSPLTLAAPGDGPGHAHGQQMAHAAPAPQHGPRVDAKRVHGGIEKHRGQFGSVGKQGHDSPRFAKGEKLPKGVKAHALDRRVTADLPHYKGYEWRRVGTDLILVSVATGIIYAVFDHVLH